MHPEAVVLGRPVFDASARALRVNGRKISNFWANLETLGWGVDDSLFGMRLYPLAELVAVMESTRFARRFDFEPEVAVRLAWHGVPVINLGTPVRYLTAAEGGVSQFRYLRDNLLLSWMHSRLFFGFLWRMPRLLWRGRNPLDPPLATAPVMPAADQPDLAGKFATLFNWVLGPQLRAGESAVGTRSIVRCAASCGTVRCRCWTWGAAWDCWRSGCANTA